jgi:predicted phosphate transport protein (TIGR00153 family)
VKFTLFSFGRKESAIVEGIENHLAIVMGTVGSFTKLLVAAASGNSTEVEKLLSTVLAGEKRADDVHRKLSMEIAEGAFFGGVREDILELLEKIDNIADSAKDASRFLAAEGALDPFAISLLKSPSMSKFVENQVGAVAALQDLVSTFKIGKKEMLSRIPRVEHFEEAADADKDDLWKALFQRGGSPDPVTVIQMRDFIAVADDIADNAEDASDVVLVLVAKGFD